MMSPCPRMITDPPPADRNRDRNGIADDPRPRSVHQQPVAVLLVMQFDALFMALLIDPPSV